jgi:hypothetical protein
LLFPHRTNPDGTIDSICPRCFATIGTFMCEADLERMEVAHICEPWKLRLYEDLRKRQPRSEPSQEDEPTERRG